MEQTINFEIKDKAYSMPNAWHLLSSDQFIHLADLLCRYAAGFLSVGDVRLGYVTHFLGIDPAKDKVSPLVSDVVAANLYVLLSQVTFIFNIKYPAAVWNGLSAATKAIALKTEPSDLPDTPEVRYLRTQEYHFVVDAVFAKQLIPEIKVGDNIYKGYDIRTDCERLSCTLTARQFIDASETLFRIVDNPDLLPLLAAILYCPGVYNSDWAHTHAKEFGALPAETLEAIALNFQAFILFLYEKTDFGILRQKGEKVDKGIVVGMTAGLYNLSTDGYGDLNTVSNFSVIEYLSILRKKLIESVVSMHKSGMKHVEIATETGLDMNVINQILL